MRPKSMLDLGTSSHVIPGMQTAQADWYSECYNDLLVAQSCCNMRSAKGGTKLQPYLKVITPCFKLRNLSAAALQWYSVCTIMANVWRLAHLRAFVGSVRLPSCCQAPNSFSRAKHSCWLQPFRPSCLMPKIAAPRGKDHALSEPASLSPVDPPCVRCMCHL